MLWVGPKMLTCPAPDQRLAAFLGRWNSPVRRVAACCWLSAGGAHDAGRRISSANPGRQAQVNLIILLKTIKTVEKIYSLPKFLAVMSCVWVGIRPIQTRNILQNPG